MQPPIPIFADGGDGARAGTVPAAPIEESVAMAQIQRAWRYRQLTPAKPIMRQPIHRRTEIVNRAFADNARRGAHRSRDSD